MLADDTYETPTPTSVSYLVSLLTHECRQFELSVARHQQKKINRTGVVIGYGRCDCIIPWMEDMAAGQN